MADKVVIIGDSHTFYMSTDPRKKYYLEALNKDDIELYPIYWTSFHNDPDQTTVYCWRLATSGRKLTAEVIDEIIKQDESILASDNNSIHLVFAFGALDFYAKILHTKDPVSVAKDYFDVVHKYCKENNFSFSFASPVYSNPASYLIDKFNNALHSLCNFYGSGNVIVYPPSIPYMKYQAVDKFNHAGFNIMESVAKHIKQCTKNL